MAPHIDSKGHGIHASRHDFEGALDWMAAICGPHALQVRQPQQIQFNHSGTVLRSMASTLGIVEYGTDVTISVDTGAPLNCYSISLPLTGEQELTVKGQLWRSDANTGLIISPHEAQDLAIAGNCRKIIVSIPHTAVRHVLEGLLERPLDEPIVFQPAMDAAAGEQASWWRMVKFFVSEMAASGGWLSQSHMASDLELVLLKGLLLAQPHNYSGTLAEALRPSCPHYLLRARQFIHDHAREDIELEDIEQASGVSRHRIFDGFKKHFGQAPMAYLKRYRLEAVRNDILADKALRNVSSIAMSWGFSHLGRFSADYKALFGEAPSQTALRSAQPRRR
jgi:AraC-like DNA-binding protein